MSKRFSQSRTFTVTPAIRQQLIAAGVPGAESFTGVSFFTNDFDTRTRGLDLVAAYAKRVGAGRLDLTAGVQLQRYGSHIRFARGGSVAAYGVRGRQPFAEPHGFRGILDSGP